MRRRNDGGDQILFRFNSDELKEQFLRIRVLANKAANLFDDLDIDLDVWDNGSGES
jgi:hypothetical protein